MRILIIGSKGFIGSHCVNYFSQQHNVWQCDVAVDYISKNYIQVDATNANYNDLFTQTQFDICINCSGAASVPDSISNPQRDFNLNTVNVFKQLDALRKHSPKCKYINLSSAAVYGNPVSLPVKEDQLAKPISPYGIHKKMAENICQEFYEIYKIKTCSLRVFSAYGNGLQKQLFWDLYLKAKTNNTISLFGTGNESRDFIHILDIVKAIDYIIKKGTFNNEIINIANAKEEAISKVVNIFYNYFDPLKRVSFRGENRPGDPINWVADNSKLLALGYKQTVTIEEGLKSYVKWLKENE